MEISYETLKHNYTASLQTKGFTECIKFKYQRLCTALNMLRSNINVKKVTNLIIYFALLSYYLVLTTGTRVN